MVTAASFAPEVTKHSKMIMDRGRSTRSVAHR
jgi:hypothetical protein